MPANADVFAFTMCTMLVYNWRIRKAKFITVMFLFNSFKCCFSHFIVLNLLFLQHNFLSVRGRQWRINEWLSHRRLWRHLVFPCIICFPICQKQDTTGERWQGKETHWPACSCVCMNQHVGLCSWRWMQGNKPSMSLFTVLFERNLSAKLPIWLGRTEKFISASRCLKGLINLYSLQTPANEIHVTAKEGKVMMLKQCETEHSCVCSGPVCIQAQRMGLWEGCSADLFSMCFLPQEWKWISALDKMAFPGELSKAELWKSEKLHWQHWPHCQPQIKGSAFLHLIRCCSRAKWNCKSYRLLPLRKH